MQDVEQFLNKKLSHQRKNTKVYFKGNDSNKIKGDYNE